MGAHQQLIAVFEITAIRAVYVQFWRKALFAKECLYYPVRSYEKREATSDQGVP